MKSRFVNFVRTETSSDQPQARRMFTYEDVVRSIRTRVMVFHSGAMRCSSFLPIFPCLLPHCRNILNTSCNEREFETFPLNRAGALYQKSELAGWTVIIGLPVRATPSQKKTKWRTEFSEGFACLPSVKPIFAGRGRVFLSRLANRFGSRFGANTKLLRGLFSPIFTLNDCLNTVVDDVVSLCGSWEHNVLQRSPRKKL